MRCSWKSVICCKRTIQLALLSKIILGLSFLLIATKILDSKLNFKSHIRQAILKAIRGTGMIKNLSKYVSRDVLDQVYKLYVRRHLDYGDIIYHRHDPEMILNFTKRIEQTQYSVALAVAGVWRGTNRQKLYNELDWESLYQ